MAKSYLSLLFALASLSATAKDCKIIAQSQGSITFEVDKNLQPINYKFLLNDGESLAESMLEQDRKPTDGYRIIATSFADEHNIACVSKSPFYATLISAYANHKSVTLSPDMIWLLISQGFARYVNAHAEELRPRLVSHAGKKEIIAQTDDLFSHETDWPSLINDFASQIDHFTKGNIANIITADFSTTGSVERVASQVTLMESVKCYFDYIAMTLVCGIPSITLKGTLVDWQRLLEKTRQLEQYGLGEWIKELEPILTEFIRAAEGHPNQKFWQNIVKKKRVGEVRGPSCAPKSKLTKFDGWFLKLFPNENGTTLKSATMSTSMPSERVDVDFKYQTRNLSGDILSEVSMELWAGFIGTEVDANANMLTPKIGWMALKAPSDNELLDLYKQRDEDEFGGIYLRVKEVPEVLARMEHIKFLSLEFTDKVILPKWLDRLAFDRFEITGKITDDEKEAILKRFPNATVVQR